MSCWLYQLEVDKEFEVLGRKYRVLDKSKYGSVHGEDLPVLDLIDHEIVGMSYMQPVILDDDI